MSSSVSVISRAVRQITIATDQSWLDLRAAYERAVPSFDRLEAVGVVLSGVGWDGIAGLSGATATNGLVNFYTFDPSPIMALRNHRGKVVTYLAGNIVKAEVAFGIEPAAFIYIPLRITISSGNGQDASLLFDHPRDLFEPFGSELDSVAAQFSHTLASVLELMGLAGAELLNL